MRFLGRQDSWLAGFGRRPDDTAVAEEDRAEWSRGVILDCRGFPEIRELDYNAHTPTKWNLEAIRAALKDCKDQEVVSFMVLGVCYKAEMPHQLVFCHHLLNLFGNDAAVYQEAVALSDLGGNGLFSHTPMVPGRFNGKGQVEKGSGIRPTDEAGPRKDLFDTANVRVWSLNQYALGSHTFQHLLNTESQAELEELARARQAVSGKWPHEDKPGTEHVIIANCILREAADYAQQPTYLIKADWFKMFNQFMLRPECYWQSMHSFPDNKFVVNYCMTFGLNPCSNIAQRAANAFVWFFLKEFNELDASYVQEGAAHHPKLKSWVEARSELGPQQAMLLWMCCYTDDPFWVVVGADRVVRALKLYRCINHLFGLIPAHPSKHVIGIRAVWIGVTHHVF